MATNKGKKYLKLRGDEVPTRDSDKDARKFMEWYGNNMERIRRYIGGCGVPADEDIMSDTMISIYEGIAFKSLKVVNYTAYFLRAYRGRFINQEKRRVDLAPIGEVSDTPQTDFDSDYYEREVAQFTAEVMGYVRDNFDEMSVSLFEMYVGLAPDVSYKKLAEMLGIPFANVWMTVGKIKKSVVEKFGQRKAYLLSAIQI